MRARRVLVTGAAGLIGRRVASGLVRRGCTVTALDRPGTRLPADCGPIHADVTDEQAMAELVPGHDGVVHLAGVPGLGLASSVRTYAVNVVGTFTVLHTAAAAGIRNLVYASSINASGIPLNTHPVFPARFPYDEAETPDVDDPYSLSKLENEAAARMINRRFGAIVVGLRFPLTRDFAHDSVRAAADVRRFVDDEPRRAACDGFSYLDVEDAAEAVARALEVDRQPDLGILVAAPITYLAVDTAVALDALAPEVPRDPIEGRAVALRLDRSCRILGEWPKRLLDDIAPEVIHPWH